MANHHRCPSIPRAVLALPVRLIDRLRIDAGARRASPLVMRIDILHVHEETRIRNIGGPRGIQFTSAL